ncbi:MAG: efflux RND transporter permease subunit [Balneolaceae bacterium]|nr:efflux RND transporter permease subunit [Balneolaceae bacterium]
MENLFRRRYLISLTYMIVVVVGIAAWQSISLEEAPELNQPSISISYSWGTTSPEIVEKEITRKVESAANRLRDVERIVSSTSEGSSSVTIYFSNNAPVDFRKVELQEYLIGMQESLPPNVRNPSITHRVPEELQDTQNLLHYTISGERQVNELLDYVDQNIRLPLLGVDGVSDISVQGAARPALVLEFNPQMVDRYNINPNAIGYQITTNFQWRSSGFIETSGNRYSMLVPPQYENLDDIRSMWISVPGSERRLRLSTVANVSIQDAPTTYAYRINGTPSLTIQFIKKSGADAIRLAELLRGRMDEIRSEMPEEFTLRLVNDYTEDLREQFDSLQNQALASLAVVFLILLAFIRRFRAPFVILGSIIFSLLLSLAILYFIGYTLNVLTLAGLTVALGMIIDNAVVVFEQVNPGLPDDRESRIQHVVEQLPRSVVPVLGATLTTVGIFIPLFFAMEELQLFLVPLAVALSSTLVSSVFIALSWIPYSLIWLVPPKSDSKEIAREARGFFKKFRRGLLWLFAFRHRARWFFYVALIAVFGIPIWAIETPAFDDEETQTWWPEFTRVYFDNRSDIDPWVGGLSYRFFNDIYFGSPWGGYSTQQSIYVSIRTPQGTPYEEINKMALNFERIVQPYADAFTYYQAQVNSRNETANLRFYIKDEYLTRPEPYIFYAEAQYLAARTGNSGISVGGLGDGISTGLGSMSINRSIYLTGYSYDGLLDVARDLERRLTRSRRVNNVDIHGSGGYGNEETFHYFLDPRKEEMAMRGIDWQELSQAISMDVNTSNTAGSIEMNGQSMQVITRNITPADRPEQLLNKKRISGPDSTMFTLEQVAEVSREKTQSTINRENQSYSRTVGVDFLGPHRLATDYIDGVVEETPTPVGVTISTSRSGTWNFGSSEQTRNLLFILAMTVLSVWMIVSALLESWVDPLIVISAVPLSLIGVMIGSLYHDLAFDQGAIAGTLLCVGVVVNNSILLMHEKQYLRGKGIHGIRSWLYVYRNKMRAVMVTTLTTIGGLLPILILSDHDIWQPLATIVTWGLGISTVLILLLMGLWEKTNLRSAND